MNCPTCTTPVPHGAHFCVSCGAALHDATTSIGPQATGAVPAVRSPAPTPSPRAVSSRVPSAITQDRDATAADLVSCRACGAPNSAGRVLCARCGADLTTGMSATALPNVHQPGPSVDVVGDVDVRDRPPRSRAAVIAAAIIVVGALVGVLVGILVARGADDGDVVADRFDPAVYPGDPVELLVDSVGASSVRPDAGDVSYVPEHLVDDDLTTAWSHDPSVEQAEAVGLAFVLAAPSWVTDLVIANGAQADDLAFAADGRVLRFLLLVDGEPAVELQLLDQGGLQQVTLPTPLLLSEVRLSVAGAMPGDTYDEVSLSEVSFLGHNARGADRAEPEVG